MKKGLKYTEEQKQKISNSLKGRTLSDTDKENMSKAKKGKISNCAKEVIIIYKNQEYKFNSMTECEKWFWDNLQIKTFYWLRKSIPKKYVNDVQLIKVGNEIKFSN